MLSMNELIGFGVGDGGAGGPVSSISTFSITTGTTSGTFTYPAGILAGDFIIFMEVGRNGVAHVDTNMTGSGWNAPIRNRCDATTGAVERQKTSTRICTGTESGSFSCITGTTFSGKIMLVIRGNAPIVSSVASAVADTITTADPAAQNVAASGQPFPLVVLGQYMAGAAIDPRTFTPAKDGEQFLAFSTRQMWLAWKYYNSTPANVSVDMDDEGTNYLQSYYVRFA